MFRDAIRAIVPLISTSVFVAAPFVYAQETKSDSAKVVFDTLVKFDRNWKDYKNEPNLGDPRWKLKMETLVNLAKAGGAALPLLEMAAQDDSDWAAHTRELAKHLLKFSRESPAAHEALAKYHLSQMDIAKVGKPAPDFTLADAAGQRFRFNDYRGKKTIVLSFILQDI